MAKKLTKAQHDLMALYAIAPIYRCEHCGHQDIAVCSPRAWRKAESCSYFKKFEADFYRRNAGGPVAMTSMTRGRGYFGTFEPAAHVQAYYTGKLAEENERKLAERRRTFHDAHVDAYWVQWSHDFMAQTKHQHGAHCVAYFYHLHPQHKPAWMLNPFLIDP